MTDTASPSPGWALPVVLLLAGRAVVDELHSRLAAAGHAGLRPAHGFALQTIGADGTTSSALAAQLGITKQGGGQMVDELTRLGYVERRPAAEDGRRKLVVLTARGRDVLQRSAEVLEALRTEWAGRVGEERLVALEADLLAAVALFADRSRPGLRPVW